MRQLSFNSVEDEEWEEVGEGGGVREQIVARVLITITITSCLAASPVPCAPGAPWYPPGRVRQN